MRPTRLRWALVGVLAVAALGVLFWRLAETDVIDVSYCESSVTSERKSEWDWDDHDERRDRSAGFVATITRGVETFAARKLVKSGAAVPALVLKGEVETTHAGNDAAFRLTRQHVAVYKLTLRSMPTPGRKDRVEATMENRIVVQLKGLCGQNRARQLADEKMREDVLALLKEKLEP